MTAAAPRPTRRAVIASPPSIAPPVARPALEWQPVAWEPVAVPQAPPRDATRVAVRRTLLISIYAVALLGPAFVGLLVLVGGPDVLEPTGQARLSPDLWAGLMGFNALFVLFVFAVAPWGYLHLARPDVHVLDQLGLRWKPRLVVPLAIGLAAAGAMAALAFLLDRIGLFPDESGLVGLDEGLRTHPWLILLVSFAAAVGEEIAFRGLIQPQIGLVGASVLFALAHATFLPWIVPVWLLFAGLTLGLLYKFTRTLWAPIVAHFAYDVIALASIALS